jgi:excisionase family DNA binding protein
MPDNELDGIDELISGLPAKRWKPRTAVFKAPTSEDLAVMANQKVLTIMEVSRILRLSRNATYEGVWSGDIPSVKVGKRILVPVAGLKAMLGEIDTPQSREADDQPLSAA